MSLPLAHSVWECGAQGVITGNEWQSPRGRCGGGSHACSAEGKLCQPREMPERDARLSSPFTGADFA